MNNYSFSNFLRDVLDVIMRYNEKTLFKTIIQNTVFPQLFIVTRIAFLSRENEFKLQKIVLVKYIISKSRREL